MTIFIFWFSIFLVLYIYIGYLIAIKMIPDQHENEIKEDQDYQPFVSILIAAYNEEKDIKETIDNKLALDYPIDKYEIIVVSDESTDNTDLIVESFSSSVVPVTLVRQVPRRGKTAGLNLIAPKAKGEILVFSDANSIYQSDALKYLINNFKNLKIGYVTGKMVYINPDGSMVGDGCSAYMKYENIIRQNESKIGSIVGVDGGIDAMRKSLYEPLAVDQLPDFVQPLKVIEKGYKVKYEPKAILKEAALSDPDREYSMRVRVTLRALWALKDMKVLLNPFKYSLFSFQLISHKVLRYLAFIPILAIFILNVFLFNQHPAYTVILGLQLVFYALAWVGHNNKHADNTPIIVSIPYYFVLINLACMHAFLRFIKGEKQVMWKPREG